MAGILTGRGPRIPEVDFSGVINADSHILEGSPYKYGDAVLGHIPPVKYVTEHSGVLAEKVAVSPKWIIRKADSLSHEEGAALPTSFVSAYNLASKVHKGARVFVNGGSGGIGLILLQLLKNWKQANVTTTASDQSWSIVEQQSPNNMLNYREVGDLVEHLQASFPSFDYAIDLVGDKSLLKGSSRYLGKDGMFIAFGGGLASASLWSFFAWLVGTLFTGILPAWLGELWHLYCRPRLC